MSPVICVYGLWHLGAVTAACLADGGFKVIGLDEAGEALDNLAQGKAPLFEPGLNELLQTCLKKGNITFTSIPQRVEEAEIIWVTFDTPVDEDDRADVAFVENKIIGLFPYLKEGAVVLVSSQMPAGSTAKLDKSFRQSFPGKKVHFAYSPENLRLGKAIEAFTKPERIVIGVDSAEAQAVLEPVLSQFCPQLLWLKVASAEMTKHALNSFLALCVTFANELGSLCERLNADATEVEKALRTDPRVGPKAYVAAGGAFAGGTLARDLTFMVELSGGFGLPAFLAKAAIASNKDHRQWPLRQLQARLGNLATKNICIFGLTYKPGTDTLRRSQAVELALALGEHKAKVIAYDPAIKSLPPELQGLELAISPEDAVKNAAVVLFMTEWPEFRNLSPDLFAGKIVLDQGRFMAKQLAENSAITYVTVGKPLE